MQALKTCAGTVLDSSVTSHAVVRASGDTTRVSIIECSALESKILFPVVIFTGAFLRGRWFPHNYRFEEELPYIASEFLSLMSLFDGQAMPLDFVSSFSKRQQDQDTKSRGEIQLTKDQRALP